MGDLSHGETAAHRTGSRETRTFSVRLPVVDEALVQVSDAHSAFAGRILTTEERNLARTVFSDSVDYGRVRLILGNLAARTTAGNNIRLPTDFTISRKDDKALLIHEMTHVWQFQHFGSGYITTSLLQQAHAALTRGSRNFAYEYRLSAGDSFHQFAPEQQAYIVENFYLMQYDQEVLSTPAGNLQHYNSNHLNEQGVPLPLNAAQRRAEIEEEMPLHTPLIRQMSTMPFLPAEQLMIRRMQDVMILSPHDHMFPASDWRRTPAVNLLEIRF